MRQGKSVADAKGYTAMLGHYLLHGAEMDECVALFFRAPHSYTGEDVIELSVHGGTAMADGGNAALARWRRQCADGCVQMFHVERSFFVMGIL